MKNIIIINIFIYLSFLSTAHADSSAAQNIHDNIFNALDRDKDGVLQINEIKNQEVLVREFSTLDKNSDGKLDQKEFLSFKKLNKLTTVNRNNKHKNSL
ncbi:MAG: hypothetical protein R3B45_14730 [Bdellovibrionota bacterium]